MTTNELNNILDDHQKRLKDEGGAKPNLRGAYLKGANLNGANLTYAYLNGAYLRGADLRDADIRGADLRDANLTEANLKGADLDYSCMPLWCGDLKAHYDERQIIQQLFHVLSHVKYSKNSTDRLKEVLLKDEIVDLANEFHRAEECGKITK